MIHIDLSGDYSGSSLRVTGSSGDIGIRVVSSTNVCIDGALLSGLGTGLRHSEPCNDYERFHAYNRIVARDCVVGIECDAGEYAQFSDCAAIGCDTGIKVNTGNNDFANCHARNNSVGIHLTGGLNDAHGHFTGCTSNHNTAHNLLCENVTRGETFTGCHFLGGTVELVNSIGIVLNGGQLAGTIIVDEDSKLILRGVYLRADCAFTGEVDAIGCVVEPGATITKNGAVWSGNNAETGGGSSGDVENGTFTATLTGCTTSPTCTVKYTKSGDQVTLNIPTQSGTGNSTSKTLTGIPTGLRPSGNRNFYTLKTGDGGAYALSEGYVDSGGVIHFYVGIPGAAFTNGNAFGTSQGTVVYEL